MVPGDQRPWRDVFSTADWDIILSKAGPPVGPGTQNAPGAVQLKKIRTDLAAYHLIQKDRAALFPRRCVALQLLVADAVAYLTTQAAPVKAGVGGTKDYTQGMAPWVDSLRKRAAKKDAYLVTIGAWVAGAKAKYTDPVQLMADLAARDQCNVMGTEEDPLLTTTPYAKMEKIDPYHRGITFFVNVTGTKIDPYHNNPMAVALNQWLRFRKSGLAPLVRNANASFYEWLEYHPICTGTPGVTLGFNADYKTEVKKVDYGPTLHPIQIDAIRLKIDKGVGFQLLDTASMFPPSAKGDPGAVAFAWDQGKTLWLHEHAGSFRHTSFMGGKKVRCTGMIKVVNGLVTIITPESGHYAPDDINLVALVSWLKGRGVMAASSRVGSYQANGMVKVSVDDYMTFAAANFLDTMNEHL